MDNSLLHRRERIILTAIDIINELGIQGLSIREVAKREAIATSSIFSHFKSKNELILAVCILLRQLWKLFTKVNNGG
jgi:AcrR family transcriptional regulator